MHNDFELVMFITQAIASFRHVSKYVPIDYKNHSPFRWKNRVTKIVFEKRCYLLLTKNHKTLFLANKQSNSCYSDDRSAVNALNKIYTDVHNIWATMTFDKKSNAFFDISLLKKCIRLFSLKLIISLIFN